MVYENEKNLERVKNIKGEVRGVTLKTDEYYVLKKEGEETLENVKKELERLGAGFCYEDLDKMNFYPISFRIFSLLAISKVLQYEREDIKEMGKAAPRVSFLIKFFTKYFLSSGETLKKVTEMWEKHYTEGKIEAVEVKEDEGRAIFRLHEANFHPILCDYLLGYFSSIVSMVVGEKTKEEERKCFFRGDKYHEFYITWKPSKGKN